MKLDQILLEIISFSISSIGIFNFLLRYDVPQLDKTYYGKNLYKIKARILNNIKNWFYAIPTFAGLLIIPFKEIYSDQIPQRLILDNISYIIILLITLLIVFWCFKKISILGIKHAKQFWEPVVISEIMSAYNQLEDEDLLQSNKKQAEKIIDFIENILEINTCLEKLDQRYINLKNYIMSRREVYEIIEKIPEVWGEGKKE